MWSRPAIQSLSAQPVRRKEAGLVRDERLERFIGQCGRCPAFLRALPGNAREANLIGVRADDDRFHHLRRRARDRLWHNRRLSQNAPGTASDYHGDAGRQLPTPNLQLPSDIPHSALRARISLRIPNSEIRIA